MNRCSFNDHGYTCNKPASVSPSTHGGGPWFCIDCFMKVGARNGSKREQEIARQRIGQILQRLKSAGEAKVKRHVPEKESGTVVSDTR